MRAPPHHAGAGDVVHPRWLLARATGVLVFPYLILVTGVGAAVTIVPLLWLGLRFAAPLVGPTVAVIATALLALPLAFRVCMTLVCGTFPLVERVSRLFDGRCPRCRAFALVDDAVFMDGDSYTRCERCDLHLADVGNGRAWREVGSAEWSDVHDEGSDVHPEPVTCATCGALLSASVNRCSTCGSHVSRGSTAP